VLYTLGVLVFAFGLLASIALHEIGHLTPAKIFGVRVTQYMVGFGPTLWSKRRGDTEYGVKAIPMGGYIRMIGMVPPRQDGKKSRWPRRMAELVEEFRETSRTEVSDTDGDRQFYRLTPGKKMIIMLGGPTMNLLIFLVITILLYGLIGTKEPTTKIASVSQCVVAATAQTDTCAADATPSPAAGKLQAGDKILSVGSTKITKWTQLVSIIEASAGKTLTLSVERAGATVPISITPVENTRYLNDSSNKTEQAGFIGVSPDQAYQTDDPAQIVSVIGKTFSQDFGSLKQFPAKIGSLWGTVFEGKPRDQTGAVGVVGLGRIGGQIAADKNIAVLDRISFLLDLLAGVNLLLFIFNLLPLLPLDGGHVAGALVEAARRGWARLRLRRAVKVGTAGPKRVSPIYVDVAQLVPVMYAVAGVLLVVSVFVLYADIVKPVSIN
jgi:membrane-associated protease RseP (regulator of RpoE activity)